MLRNIVVVILHILEFSSSAEKSSWIELWLQLSLRHKLGKATTYQMTCIGEKHLQPSKGPALSGSIAPHPLPLSFFLWCIKKQSYMYFDGQLIVKADC